MSDEKTPERRDRDRSEKAGWRKVFGQARREEVEETDAIIADELEGVDPETWK